MEKRDKQTLIPLIKKYIRKETIIVSDMWAAYEGLEEIQDYNYVNIAINHSEHFVYPSNPEINTQKNRRKMGEI